MSEFDRWESRLEETARTFSYPPTPDIAHAVSQRLPARPAQNHHHRRVAWSLAAAALVIAGLLLVPPVRAGILEVLRIGAVRIRLVEPTITPPPTSEPAPAQPTSEPAPAQPTITPPPAPLTSVLDLEGETTLDQARQSVTFPIRLPSYPADLGLPDKVFVQDFGEPLLILVWLDDEQPERVRLSLYQFPPGLYAEKSRPETITPATVNGGPAFWTQGPHLLLTRSRRHVFERLVDGPVLIWTERSMTYRLEGDLSQAEAIRIAESLQ